MLFENPVRPTHVSTSYGLDELKPFGRMIGQEVLLALD